MIGWRRRSPRRVLVLGGARSGKSRLAETMLGELADVGYVACGLPADGTDPEWDRRIALHRERRPASWITHETRELAALLEQPGHPVLVDCLSTWLAGVMDDCGVWTDLPDADAHLAVEVDRLVSCWASTPRRVIAVSSEVGSGIVPATPSGRRFRDELGSLNSRVAASCDAVWLVTAGIAQRLR